MNLRLNEIKPLDQITMSNVKNRIESLAKPLNSLGKLEDLFIKLSGIYSMESFDIDKKALVIMCADNGVVEEGISQSGQEITAIVTNNFAKGLSTVNQFAKIAGVDVFPVDIGIANDQIDGRVISRKIKYGTDNLRRTSAMSLSETYEAISVGINLVKDLKDKNYKLIATGEMGIGNTTTSSALCSVLLNKKVDEVTGRGAGLSDEGLSRKMIVIQEAIEFHHCDSSDPVKLLSQIGGLDIAGMVGLYIGGGIYQLPIVIDGIISGVAALIAYKLNPSLIEYMLPSHVSKEPAGKWILESLGLSPLLSCEMGLGEGTGAVAMLPLLDMMNEVYNKLPTFEMLKMDQYQKFKSE